MFKEVSAPQAISWFIFTYLSLIFAQCRRRSLNLAVSVRSAVITDWIRPIVLRSNDSTDSKLGDVEILRRKLLRMTTRRIENLIMILILM